MIRLSIVGAAAALCLAASPAAAEPFEMFSAACMENDARRDAVAASMAKAGWFALPDEELKAFEGEGISNASVYFGSDPASAAESSTVETVMTGWAAADTFVALGGLGVEFCAVMSSEGDKPTLDQKMERMFGFPPTDIGADQVWLFAREDGRYRPAPPLLDLPEADMAAMARKHDLYMAATILEDGMTITVIGAIRPLA